jgi:hypothetical protein
MFKCSFNQNNNYLNDETTNLIFKLAMNKISDSNDTKNTNNNKKRKKDDSDSEINNTSKNKKFKNEIIKENSDNTNSSSSSNNDSSYHESDDSSYHESDESDESDDSSYHESDESDEENEYETDDNNTYDKFKNSILPLLIIKSQTNSIGKKNAPRLSKKKSPIIKTIACCNKNCDHKSYDNEWFENNKIDIKEIKTLKDLVILSENYHCKMRKDFNGVNLEKLYNAKEQINELINMIGLNEIKKDILDNLIYFSMSTGNNDMLHMVVTGSPGCGKTTFIDIIAKLYAKIGILKKGHVIKAKRSDLIGQYLGSTAIKTKEVIKSAYGGILLIDEAYSLGNADGRDSFSKECLDTLNQHLSENKENFICIIAGYKDDLETSFFGNNQGLRRRFPYQYDFDSYKDDELSKIFFNKLNNYKIWKLDFKEIEIIDIIKKNKSYIINQGGDMETVFLNLKIIHNRRVFLLPIEEKNIVNIKDIQKSFDKLIDLRKKHMEKGIEHNKLVSSMYI